MDERMRFVIRLKDGESMASLCREFGIFAEDRIRDLRASQRMRSGRTQRPGTPAVPVCQSAAGASGGGDRGSQAREPHWGARKIRERLLRRLPHAIKVPAASTVHTVLDRHGLVQRMARPRTRAEGTPLSNGLRPNDLWTDYKGAFQLGDKRYCYPLTVTDHASRYLLLCKALESNREELALRAFDRLFRERGLPEAIRSDNGLNARVFSWSRQ